MGFLLLSVPIISMNNFIIIIVIIFITHIIWLSRCWWLPTYVWSATLYWYDIKLGIERVTQTQSKRWQIPGEDNKVIQTHTQTQTQTWRRGPSGVSWPPSPTRTYCTHPGLPGSTSFWGIKKNQWRVVIIMMMVMMIKISIVMMMMCPPGLSRTEWTLNLWESLAALRGSRLTLQLHCKYNLLSQL